MKKLIVMAAAVSALALLACGPGEGEDAGEDLDAGSHDAAVAQCPATGGTCTVAAEGQCQGDLLLYCDENNKLQCDNCKTVDPVAHVCAQYNTTYGYDCLAGLGQACDPTFPSASATGVGCIATLTCSTSTNKCE